MTAPNQLAQTSKQPLPKGSRPHMAAGENWEDLPKRLAGAKI